MNSKTPACVKSIMTLYSSLGFRLLCHATQTFVSNKLHVLDLTCFLAFALIRATFLSLVSVSGNIFEQAPSCIFFSVEKKKIISCNLTSRNMLISKKLSPVVNF